jgi:hypothetical protein
MILEAEGEAQAILTRAKVTPHPACIRTSQASSDIHSQAQAEAIALVADAIKDVPSEKAAQLQARTSTTPCTFKYAPCM